MSEQRIERWALVAKSGALVATYFSSRIQAQAEAIPGERVIRLVEIRDGEPHPDKVREITDELQVQAIDAINRAEKANLAVRARDTEIDTLRSILKQFEDGGMSGREVREAQNDAAAKFERWAAVRFFGKPWQCSATNEVHYFGRAEAMDEARQYRSHYFPPAKEV